MALSTTGRLTFKVRLTPITGTPRSFVTTVAEAPNCDQTARAQAVAQAGWLAAEVSVAEVWILATDAT